MSAIDPDLHRRVRRARLEDGLTWPEVAERFSITERQARWAFLTLEERREIHEKSKRHNQGRNENE